MFHEMRMAARLLENGASEDEVLRRIVAANLFQYPTERSIWRHALVCLKRLKALNDADLVFMMKRRFLLLTVLIRFWRVKNHGKDNTAIG